MGTQSVFFFAEVHAEDVVEQFLFQSSWFYFGVSQLEGGFDLRKGFGQFLVEVLVALLFFLVNLLEGGFYGVQQLVEFGVDFFSFFLAEVQGLFYGLVQ